jgi:hypothetical protein
LISGWFYYLEKYNASEKNLPFQKVAS